MTYPDDFSLFVASWSSKGFKGIAVDTFPVLIESLLERKCIGASEVDPGFSKGGRGRHRLMDASCL